MTNKKADRPKLQNFSYSAIEQLEKEIFTVLKQLKAGKLTYRNAFIRLHGMKNDSLSIYWYIVTRLNETSGYIRNKFNIQNFDEMNNLDMKIFEDVDWNDMEIKKIQKDESNDL
jgi:hypothetical protein